MNNRYSVFTLRYLPKLLGIVFVLSAGSKAFNILAFSSEIRLYCDTYIWKELSFWSHPIAIVVCAIEMILGILSFTPKYRAASMIIMLIMLTFFVWLTGINYFSPSIFGSIESCGCFGELIHFSPFGAFVKSLMLWIIALPLGVTSSRILKLQALNNVLHDEYLITTIVVSPILPLFSYMAFDSMTHLCYGLSYIALCIILLFLASKNTTKIQKKV